MAATENDARRGLMDCLLQQGREYSQVMEVLNQLPADASLTDPSSESVISRLQTALRKASIAEAKLTAAREVYERLGRPSSPELRQLLSDQEVLLSRFIEAIDEVQTRFSNARDRLLPQMDGTVRRRAMHSAYQKSLRTG
ncbi:MAG: hypothetical protein R3C19_20760 [Planctomycetaceae bacterium]